MIKRIKKFFSKMNQSGNVLSTSILVMVVLASTVATVSAIASQQGKTTSLRLEAIEGENFAMRLIQQAINEFEQHLTSTSGDFVDYEVNEIPSALQKYSVHVERDYSFEGFGPDDDARCYRFFYNLENERQLQKFVYVSSVGTTIPPEDEQDQFSFSMGTNGDLVLTAGWYEEVDMYGHNIYLNQYAGYIYNNAFRTTSSGSYPNFSGDGADALIDVYYHDSYAFCGDLCWDYNTATNQFILETSNMTDIPGEDNLPDSLDYGDYNQGVVINDLFAGYDLTEDMINTFKTIGPKGDETIVDTITEDNFIDKIREYSDEPEYICEWVPIWNRRGTRIRRWEEQCHWEAPDTPYTDYSNYDDFDPYYDEEYPNTAVVYDTENDDINGNQLVIRNTFKLDNYDTEAMVIIGDLVFDNSSSIAVDGTFIVTGDLIFQGSSIDIDGTFYVMGETIMDFNFYSGLYDMGGQSNDIPLTLLSKDNIKIENLWSTYWPQSAPEEMDVYFYTDESIFVDAMYSRMNLNGVFFAAAKGETDNVIPVEYEDGSQVEGIVIMSYRGYISYFGYSVQSNNDVFNRFYLQNVHQDYMIADQFRNTPDFDPIIYSDGPLTFESGDFSYAGE